MPYGLPAARRALQNVAHLVEIDVDFGDKNVVGCSGNSGKAGNPTGVASHGFDHHHAAV